MTANEIYDLLEPKTSRGSLYYTLTSLWRKGLILRSEAPITIIVSRRRGRLGIVRNVTHSYVYGLGDERVEFKEDIPVRLVKYRKELDKDKRRGGIAGGKSVRQAVEEFLKEQMIKFVEGKNVHGAFYTTEVAKAIGLGNNYVTTALRHLERKGKVLFHGYRYPDGTVTPFKDGFIVAYILDNIDRKKALDYAISAINKRMADSDGFLNIVNRIYDLIYKNSRNGKLTFIEELQEQIGQSLDVIKAGLKRVAQIYKGIRKVMIGSFAAYYLEDVIPNLESAIKEAEHWFSRMRSAQVRYSHNWEAAVEWFILKMMHTLKVREQRHRRKKMDPRRFTSYDIVHKTRQEFDRVFDEERFTGNLTYVLECKSTMVTKRDLDIFIEKLKNSVDFGVSTPKGREIKTNVIPIFAARFFNPREVITVDNEVINLPTYAARLNIRLITAAELNEILRKRGVDKYVTVQKICKYAKNEKEVRSVLDKIWSSPADSKKILRELITNNRELIEEDKNEKLGSNGE